MMPEAIRSAHVKATSFRRAAELTRSKLWRAGLTIFAESDVRVVDPSSPSETGSGKILYVASPILLLEALAFDRSSAVFLPVQVTVLATHDGAAVHWMDPAALLSVRLPIGASRPLSALYVRISRAFSGDHHGAEADGKGGDHVQSAA